MICPTDALERKTLFGVGCEIRNTFSAENRLLVLAYVRFRENEKIFDSRFWQKLILQKSVSDKYDLGTTYTILVY